MFRGRISSDIKESKSNCACNLDLTTFVLALLNCTQIYIPLSRAGNVNPPAIDLIEPGPRVRPSRWWRAHAAAEQLTPAAKEPYYRPNCITRAWIVTPAESPRLIFQLVWKWYEVYGRLIGLFFLLYDIRNDLININCILPWWKEVKSPSDNVKSANRRPTRNTDLQE